MTGETSPLWRAALESSSLRERYEELFGERFAALNVSNATAAVAAAERRTANAFGAVRTHFLTCGTSLANQIGFATLAEPGSRALVDRTCHQSLHYAALRSACRIAYTRGRRNAASVDAILPDVTEIVDLVAVAERAGDPIRTVILSASSYDGVMYDLPRVLAACLAVSPGLAFLVDEAWTAVHNFHPALRRVTAAAAAAELRRTIGRVPPMVVTQSAHKSMAAARQGSYLHVYGEGAHLTRVEAEVARYQPATANAAILATLDLARAHAERDGARLVERALRLSREFRRSLRSEAGLRRYAIREPALTDEPLLRLDPLRLMLDTSGIRLTGDQVKTMLFRDYDVYASRAVEHGLLVTFHLGIGPVEAARLGRALASIARRAAFTAASASPAGVLAPASPVETRVSALPADAREAALVIAYPPGVPDAAQLCDLLIRCHGPEQRTDPFLYRPRGGSSKSLLARLTSGDPVRLTRRHATATARCCR